MASATPAPNPPPPKAPQPAAPEPAVPPETRRSVPPENNPSKKQPLKAPRDSLAEALPEAQSLPEALAFIADKVGSENEFDFVARFRDPGAGREIVEHLSYKASNVTIDPNRCRVSYRWHVEQDYRGMPDQDRTVELRLAKSITVQTISQALTELNSAAGHPFSVSAQPQAYAVHIARWDSPTGDNLYFRDSRTAARVGEVARRAMALCDDKDRQAFRGR